MKRKFTKKKAAPLTPEEVAKKATEVAKQNQDKAIRQRTFDVNNEVARIDTPITLMQRLFRVDVRGERIFKENIPPIEWDDGKIEIKGPELDSFDQDVLYGLLAIGLDQHEAGEEGEPGEKYPELEIKTKEPRVFKTFEQLKEINSEYYNKVRSEIGNSVRYWKMERQCPEGTERDEWAERCYSVIYTEEYIPEHQKEWYSDVNKGKLEMVGKFETVEVKTSLAQLRKMIGASRGSIVDDKIKDSITRLSAVIIRQTGKSGAWGLSHLMFGAVGDGRDSISVRFSWRLTETLLNRGAAGEAQSYVRMKMAERRQLSPGLPRLLHSYLMSRNIHRQAVAVSEETIIGRFYATPKKGHKMNRMLIWRRQQAIKEAFTEIGEVLGATIAEKGGVWTVRP